MGYPRVYARAIQGQDRFLTIRFDYAGQRSGSVAYIPPNAPRGTSISWTEDEVAGMHSGTERWILVFEAEESPVAEPDTAHHAPSPTADTAAPITPPDECFAVRNTGYGACEATIHRDKNTMNVSIPCGDEALTKRERFAMEFVSAMMIGSPHSLGIASGAVLYADALIAELAKERK